MCFKQRQTAVWWTLDLLMINYGWSNIFFDLKELRMKGNQNGQRVIRSSKVIYIVLSSCCGVCWIDLILVWCGYRVNARNMWWVAVYRLKPKKATRKPGRVTLLRSAELTETCKRLLDITVQYSRSRWSSYRNISYIGYLCRLYKYIYIYIWYIWLGNIS